MTQICVLTPTSPVEAIMKEDEIVKFAALLNYALKAGADSSVWSQSN